ncbi:hypothetical protein D9619_012301 [Psilocybe cf. subviscida]|uniref:F-box domain-containing protein n=1 Tax=Psilocybe cf. subviscida TaxID=2480587 RepID=A0A8H5AR76_9AGAR|nr:hypothetical protein D9619_012301 [Psilocybe cf. subviscida]
MDFSWHIVAHVSQRWRSVALEAATLWTKPPTTNHAYTLLMLERSRMSLLDVVLNGLTSIATVTAVLDHITRIESLSILQDALGCHHCQSHLLKLGQNVPHLRILRIRCILRPMSGVPSPVFRLSVNTFQRPVSLQQIHFGTLDYDWNIFPIPSLTVLSLKGCRLSDPPSWMHLQDALRGMPLLEAIAGFNFKDLGLSSPGPSSPQPLNMARLRMLDIIGGSPPAIEYFISNTKFPRLRNSSIILSSNNTENSYPDDYMATVQVVLSLLAHGDFGHLGCLEVKRTGFALSQVVPPLNLSVDRRQFKYRHRYSTTPVAEVQLRVVRDMMKGLATLPSDPLAYISRLKLVESTLIPDDLVELFGGLPQLQSIDAYCSPHTMIQCLRVSSLHAPNTPVPFANLREVNMWKSDDDGDYIPSFMGDLYHCLKLRREFGSMVRKLSLNCKLTPEQVESIREVVGDVIYTRDDD